MPIVDIAPAKFDTTLGRPEGFAVTPGEAEINRDPVAEEKAKTPWLESTSISDALGAAFRQDNTVGSLLSQNRVTGIDDGTNPWESIKGTKYEPQFASFADARDQRSVDNIKRQLDQEAEDKKLLSDAPWYESLPAQMIAGVVDLPSLIPGGAFVRGAKGGFSVARSAASVGAAAGAGAAVQEIGLHATQETRTGGESAVNIGGAVLLGGLLGAGGAKLLSGGEWFRAARDLDREAHLGSSVPGTPVASDLLSGEGVSARVLAQHYPGFEAYHGSPHDFDRFDLSKIGTGEGNQAYGHGLYFAENEAVARDYRKALSPKGYDSGHAVGSPDDSATYIAAGLIDKLGGREAAAAEAMATAKARPDPFNDRVARILNSDANVPPLDSGSLYKVRINADHEHFLDWDKPFSEQSEFVRKALAGHADSEVAGTAEKHGAVSGRAFYERLKSRRTSQAEVSSLLNDSGIHGIKYLDAGSRDVGEGSRNFVVFDDKLIQILDKNGVPVNVGLGGGGGISRSIGAAATTAADLADNSIAGSMASGVAAATQKLNPALRALHSPSAVYREEALKLFENALYLKKNDEGIASEPAVETFMKGWNAGLAKAVGSTEEAFRDYVKAGGPTMPRSDFREAVGKAMRRGDEDPNPFVAKVAKEWRDQVFDPLKKQAIEMKLLPEDVSVETAQSYFSRMWNQNKLIAQEGRFKQVVQDWVKNESPKWAEQFDKGVERRLSPIQREIDDLEMSKLRRGEEFKQRGDVADTSEMTEGDIRQALRIVNGGAPKPKGVKTLSQFVLEAGGLVDDAGELAHRGITNKARPGLIRTERRSVGGKGGGWTLDDMARHAWENEYFPEHANRPSIDEFVEALNDDFHKVRAVLKHGDKDAYKLNEIIAQLEADLNRAGVPADGKQVRFSTSEEMKGAVERVHKALDAEADRKIAALKDRLSQRQADARVDRESRFIGDPNQQGRDIADEVFNSLTGRAGEGVRPDMITVKARGPLKERTFNIPDHLVEDFLEHDVDVVGRRYTRMMGADVELARKFGSVDMAEQIAKIREDYQALRANAGTEKERMALGKRETADINDLESMRDMLRGTDPAKSRVEQNYGKIIRSVNHVNYLRQMGEVALASLSETVRPAMVHGLGSYMQTIGHLATNLKGVKLSVAEAKQAGNIVDGVLGHRLATLADINDPYASRGPIEAFLENMTNFASKWNGIGMLTDMQKSITAVMTQDRILSGAAKFSEAKPVDKRFLAYMGIDQSMAERIAAQFSAHGENVDGVKVANAEKWTDEVAKRTYRAAINKDLDSIITTKGVADTPLFANTATGKAMLQFKSFALASHQRVLLRGLQESQTRFLGGLIAMSTIGMMATWMKAVSGNRTEKLQDIAKNPGWWISEGIDKAGIFAVPMELANTFEKATSFNPIKTPLKVLDEGQAISQKNQNRSLMGSIAGPSAGLVDDASSVLGIPNQIYKGDEVTKGQKNAAERLLPFNSYMGVRQILRYVVNPQQ